MSSFLRANWRRRDGEKCGGGLGGEWRQRHKYRLCAFAAQFRVVIAQLRVGSRAASPGLLVSVARGRAPRARPEEQQVKAMARVDAEAQRVAAATGAMTRMAHHRGDTKMSETTLRYARLGRYPGSGRFQAHFGRMWPITAQLWPDLADFRPNCVVVFEPRLTVS